MDKIDLAGSEQLSLAPIFGYENAFLFVNVHTILNTWVVLAMIGALAVFVRWVLYRYKKPALTHFAIISCGEFFIDTCEQTLGYFSFIHGSFVLTLFVFLLLCNTLSIIPGLEEPTVDLNTPVCLSLISFLYIQCASIYEHGIVDYVKGYFAPMFFMLPLNIISKCTTILSMSLRLFGNIFAGAIITTLCATIAQQSVAFEFAFLGPSLVATLFFIVFEGSLQAVIFSGLSLTYLSMALQDEGGH